MARYDVRAFDDQWALYRLGVDKVRNWPRPGFTVCRKIGVFTRREDADFARQAFEAREMAMHEQPGRNIVFCTVCYSVPVREFEALVSR